MGYRVVQPGFPAALGVLATPQLADDASLAVRRLDLALVLLLATLAGVAAALAGARTSVTGPVPPGGGSPPLRAGAGEGRPDAAAHSGSPPLEFEPVFGAFERMAADIRSSQDALEEARKRTAAVLATVATGVVALDPQGRVLIANPQAVDILAREPARGGAVPRRISAPSGPRSRWWSTASSRDPEAESAAELEVGGRRLTLQLAPARAPTSGAW